MPSDRKAYADQDLGEIMNKYIVTIKLPENPAHDPNNKITGGCPLSEECTDVTGQHHSALADGHNLEDVRMRYEQGGYHVTRIERLALR